MADINHATDSAYSPEMDGPSHEATYRGFVHFVEIATTVVICWVLSLAVGGVREAWISAIFGVVLGAIGGAVGALSPNLGWRAPAVVALLLALMLAFY